MNRQYFIYFVSLIALVGCNRREIFNQEVKSEYCSNEHVLLSVNDSVEIFDLKLNSKIDSLLIQIEKKISFEGRVNLGLKYEELNLSVFASEGLSGDLHNMPKISIHVNENSKVLIQFEEATSIKDISVWLEQNYPTYKGGFGQFIQFQWAKDSSEEIIRSCINEIIEGYLLSVNKYSHEIFEKSLCELSEVELKEIEFTIPFNLELQNISNQKFNPLLQFEMN